MSKLTVYMRVAKGARGPRVYASSKPNYEPLYDKEHKHLPTAFFALELDIPDDLFHLPEKIAASIEIPEREIKVSGKVA
jgi:hypothetical protein